MYLQWAHHPVRLCHIFRNGWSTKQWIEHKKKSWAYAHKKMRCDIWEMWYSGLIKQYKVTIREKNILFHVAVDGSSLNLGY